MATTRKLSAKTKAEKTPPSGAAGCIGGMCSPKLVHAFKAPAPKGTYDLITQEGPGLFLSGFVSKQGGASGLSGVRLIIDDQIVVGSNFVEARNLGLMQQNPFGLVSLDSVLGSSVLQAITFGWPVPLVFRKSLIVRVTVNEPGVVQILARVIRGSL
jgi:hypothetical protein